MPGRQGQLKAEELRAELAERAGRVGRSPAESMMSPSGLPMVAFVLFAEPRTVIRGLISRFIPHASFFVSDYRFVLACLFSTSLCFISCLLAEPNRAPPALPRSHAQGSSHENSTEAHTTWPDATHRLVYYNLHIELKLD